MRSRFYAGGALAVLAALVAAAIIVSNPLSTDAAVEDMPIVAAPQTEVLVRADAMVADEVSQSDDMGQLQAAPNSEEVGKPYIGVVIYPLSDGSVKVVKVSEDGPSDGVLEAGDIITSVNGEAIGEAKDLTDAIAASGAGAVLALTITRDDSSMDVTLTVGEYEEAQPVAKPYIGIVVSLSEDGSTEVVKVLEDGPSQGVLEVGDIIAAVNDEAVDGIKDLTNAIVEAGAGAALTLTVTRDGSDMDAAVTVGEWTEKAYPKRSASHKAGRGQDRVSSSQIVIADDDGNYHTYRTVFGNLTALDADAGTFTLQPKDGSDPIEYTISDDARIFVGRNPVDDLSGLAMSEQTVVMDIDGAVKVVKQSETGVAGGVPYRMGKIRGFGAGGRLYHRSFVGPLDIAEIHKARSKMDVDVVDRIRGARGGMGSGLGGFGFGRDVEGISSLMKEIDDSLIATYALDGFEESLKKFLEDPGSGGRVSVRRDGNGLNITLRTDEGAMSFTIPAADLTDDDSS